jgi:hypothetical protein
MYFLTAIYRPIEESFYYPNGDVRCFGYFENRQKALLAADENLADMHECLYNWLLIEKIPEGLHVMPTEEIWYQWDTGLECWVHVEKPKWSFGTINWSIG